LAVFLPIALLVGILLILIHVIIRAQFLSLGKLTKVMDKQDGMHLAKINELSSKDVPIEIAPFVFSINALLSRVGQAMQKQQRFIADAAHELRTPIAALALQSENLAHATTEQDREERQHVLQQSLLRLRNLVAQLLDLARLQSEENVSIQEISFNMVVQDVSADMFPIAEAADIDLGMLRQDENIIVGDKQGRLGQLVRNAIENAIHFTPHGGKVDISLYKQDGKAVLIVEDSGKGIPEAELEQVMQPFYRVMEGVQPGSGLGLAISHEIAQRLGGSIILANREHGGLQFKYEQPLL
jgi:two-component system OmpR family sensor kinase